MRVGVHAHLFHYIYHHVQSCSVCSSWEGRYIPPITTLPLYVLCDFLSLVMGGGEGCSVFVSISWYKKKRKRKNTRRCNWFELPTSLPPFMLIPSIEKSSTCHTGRSKTKREKKGCHYYCSSPPPHCPLQLRCSSYVTVSLSISLPLRKLSTRDTDVG